MSQKKLMLLGGLRYLLPVIDAAHKLGCKVITVDYLPHNIAHKYSDGYFNISILDKEAVLSLAKRLKIDGIMSFAVDPGVVTAAYVAEKLNLPFQGSYESVKILQDKALFRRFLTENGFNVPKAKGYSRLEDAMKDKDFFTWPVIVKPVDSAGSKGVSRVDVPEDLPEAVCLALAESHSGNLIIEEFLEKEGNSSDTDCFSVNGNLVFCSFSDQLFDSNATNPYTPSAYCWPATMPGKTQSYLHSELQRLIDLLHLKTGIYNIETRLCKDGKPYIMEVSPRGGGNRLAEMLDIATRSNLVENSVRAALGEELLPVTMPVYKDYLAEIILHADKSGIFDSLEISDKLKRYVIEVDLWVNAGDRVKDFSGANNAIGTLTLRFPTRETLCNAMTGLNSLLNVRIRE